MEYFRTLTGEYARLRRERAWVIGIVLGACVLIAACVVNFHAGIRATANAGAPLHDILLDAIPRVDVLFLYFYGPATMQIFTLCTLLLLPRFFPLALASVSLVVLTRAAFINMTHLGKYFDAPYIHGSYYMFGGDLFFSGHVAIPFIYALVFWRYPALRYAFIAFTILLGGLAVLGHHHYSIDIFAAPFISYGLYMLLIRYLPVLERLTNGEDSRGGGKT